MNKLLTALAILLIATVSYAQKLHHEEKLKISIPFGEEYDYKNIKVKRVIDGDKLLLENGERVRLIGIDTPEIRPNDKAKRDSKRTGKDLETITKMGQEATKLVKGLDIEGKKVRLEFDVDRKDKYGRLLAYVYVTIICGGGENPRTRAAHDFPANSVLRHIQSHSEEIMINTSLIRAGYATPMTILPNIKYSYLFRKFYEEARKEGRGLWAKEENRQCTKENPCTNMPYLVVPEGE